MELKSAALRPDGLTAKELPSVLRYRRTSPGVTENVSSSQSRTGAVVRFYGVIVLIILPILTPSEPNSSCFACYPCSQTHRSRISRCCNRKCRGTRSKNAFGTSDNRIRQITFQLWPWIPFGCGAYFFSYIYIFFIFSAFAASAGAPQCFRKWQDSEDKIVESQPVWGD